MKFINRLIGRFGVIVVPVPPSAKSLREHANVGETFHPARGGKCVRWMRTVADLIDPEVRNG
ncbi:hypothetical protein STBA_10690 [Streptomyces sp. MP131-18]|nr:hypothetical protein STBA_10690 [Streptomyces sp. MP131-18]